MDPYFQGQRVGSRLLNFVEEGVKEGRGRMVLVDTLQYLIMKRLRNFI
jgi:hypothetical protein